MTDTMTTQQKPFSYGVWGAVWLGGLMVVGYGAFPRPDAAFFPPVEGVTPPMPKVVTMPTPCWQPLAEYAAAASVKGSVDVVRGSLVSQGQRFTLQQDASGHLYRQPILDNSSNPHNDKRTGINAAAYTVHDTGNLNDSMRLRGVVDHFSNIQRCDGRRASYEDDRGAF